MEKFKKLVQTKTFSHSVITFSGTLINGILGTLFFILLARFLGPVNFGLVSVAILTLTLVADVADLGINSGLINFVSKHISENTEEAYRFMKLGLQVKFLVWIVVAVVGYFISGLVAHNFFLKPELEIPLKMAFVGVGGALLFSFVANSLQAFQKYSLWSILNISSNSFRLFLICLLGGLFYLDVETAITVYVVVPFLFFLIGLLFLPTKFLLVKNEDKVLKSFFNYNKWVGLSIFIAAISSRLDTFILTRLVNIREVGLYSVATQLASTVPQFVYALAIVVAPKLGSFVEKKQAATYLKKLQVVCLGLFLIGLLVIPVGGLLIPYFYGSFYMGSVTPFSFLMLSQLFFLLSVPAHQAIFYYFSKPRVFVVFSLCQLLLIGVLSWFLTKELGIVGASIAMLIGSIFNFLIPSLWVLKKLRV